MNWLKKIFKKKTTNTIEFQYGFKNNSVEIECDELMMKQNLNLDLNGWNHFNITFDEKNPIPNIEITSEKGTTYSFIGLVEKHSKLDPKLHHMVWSEKDGKVVDQPKCPMCDVSNSICYNPEHPEETLVKCEKCGREEHVPHVGYALKAKEEF